MNTIKQFDLITESDARVMEPGTTVALSPGGHITPLARDTLRSRRITVLGGPLDAELAELAPVMPVGRVAVGSDHRGVDMKSTIAGALRARGLGVIDVGTDSTDPVDYPDIAAHVGRLVARREADAGIVIDGAGLGSAIAANKIAGVRAALCLDERLARYAREHNGANVLALGAGLISIEASVAIVRTFLETPLADTRFLRRLAKIRAIEKTERL